MYNTTGEVQQKQAPLARPPSKTTPEISHRYGQLPIQSFGSVEFDEFALDVLFPKRDLSMPTSKPDPSVRFELARREIRHTKGTIASGLESNPSP